MNMKKLLCGLAAFFTCTTVTVGSFAAGTVPANTYLEKALPFAEQGHSDVRNNNLQVRSDGTVDYFIARDKNAEYLAPKHYQSKDRGETWKQIDTSWFQQIKKKYPGHQKLHSIFIDDDGTLYCVTETGDGKITKKNTVYGFPTNRVFKITSGTVHEIPNLVLGYPDAITYWIRGVEDNGDIIIAQDIFLPSSLGETNAICVYDGKTGKLKAKTNTPNEGLISGYSNGLAYYLDDSNNLVAFDVYTGKEARKIPLPTSKRGDIWSICFQKGGTMFMTDPSGLYCLDPKSTQFQKLLDGKFCRLGSSDAWRNLFVEGSACAEDGTIYIPIFYQNPKRTDDINFAKLGRLYRYSPVAISTT